MYIDDLWNCLPVKIWPASFLGGFQKMLKIYFSAWNKGRCAMMIVGSLVHDTFIF